jgi:hypothetical protein
MIVDYSVIRPPVAALKAAGVTAVGRYIGWDSEPGFASMGKNLTKAEAGELTAAGISVFVAFEYTADAVTKGASQGKADGQLATRQLAALGAPPGVTVYFAVDFDIPDYAPHLPGRLADAAAKLGPAADYFTAIAALGPAYKIGVYGGYWACSRALDAKLAVMAWQTVAWSGGQRDPRAVLYQTAGTTVLGGADVNIHEGTSADFGQWPRPSVLPGGPEAFHGEYIAAGQFSLAQLAAKLGTVPAALLRMTAVHYQTFGNDLAGWLNAVASGTRPPSAPLPAGIKLWVD